MSPNTSLSPVSRFRALALAATLTAGFALTQAAPPAKAQVLEQGLGGAVIGGVLVGLIQSVVVSWFFATALELRWFSVLQLTFAFLVILVVLLFRPSGLFGTSRVERV